MAIYTVLRTFHIRSSNWIILNTTHAQSVDYLRVGRSVFAFTTQHVVIEVPERTSDCSELKTFKTFSHKKRISIPMTRGRDRKTDLALTLTLPGHGESVRGSLMRERFVSSDRTKSPDLLRFM